MLFSSAGAAWSHCPKLLWRLFGQNVRINIVMCDRSECVEERTKLEAENALMLCFQKSKLVSLPVLKSAADANVDVAYIADNFRVI